MEKKLTCVIVDDESKGRRLIKSICEEYCKDVEVIGEAESAFVAEKIIQEKSPDFIFLDIRMPMKDGFQLLESIGNINFQVIFTTAYDQYAVRAFKFSAIDYLLKPIDIDDLANAVDKVRKNRSLNHKDRISYLLNSATKGLPSKIAFSNSDGYIFLEPKNIIRCEAYGNYTKVYLKSLDKSTLISKSLKHFDEILKEYEFYRVHKSHVVNLNHIKKFVKGKPAKLIMVNDSEVEVSIRKRDELIEILTNK